MQEMEPTARIRATHIDIIESLPPSDGYASRTGKALFDELNDGHTLPARYVYAVTKDEFVNALESIPPWILPRRATPILHIETHGYGVDGLSLGSGEIFTWRDLKTHLVKLNEASSVNLIVFMAACNGTQLVQLLEPHDRAPFRMMIGPSREVSYKEILVGSRAFYASIGQRASGNEAFDTLNSAIPAGDRPFNLHIAEQAFFSVMRNYFSQHSQPGVIEEQRQRLMHEWNLRNPKANFIQRAAKRERWRRS